MINKEDLKNYDYTIAIDRSFSMRLKVDHQINISRWQYVRELALGLTFLVSELDRDGKVDGIFFDSLIELVELTPENVDRLFKTDPIGSQTNLHLAIEAFKNKVSPKLNDENSKSMLLIVFDGEPSDTVGVAKQIIEITKLMKKDEQVGIGIIAVCRDEKVMSYLQKLDDSLVKAGAAYDIVKWSLFEDVNLERIDEFLISCVND